MYVRDIHFVEDLEEVLGSEDSTAQMRSGLLGGDVYVARKFMHKDRILKIREYLEGIGRYSLPNYCAITKACPNFHRIDRWDPRAQRSILGRGRRRLLRQAARVSSRP